MVLMLTTRAVNALCNLSEAVTGRFDDAQCGYLCLYNCDWCGVVCGGPTIEYMAMGRHTKLADAPLVHYFSTCEESGYMFVVV